MSIDMILGMAESQTQDIKNLVTKQNEAYTELQKSLTEFILQTDKLKGVTYDSAKKYCAVVIEPLVRGCILLNEEISRANENYISTYKSEVDTVSLKQQELERLIREAEGQIRRIQHLLNLLYQENPISYSQISMAEEIKETCRKLKNELEEKLKSENNNKLTDQEYDRVISQVTGINGKPLFGASLIKNANPEEKKDIKKMMN